MVGYWDDWDPSASQCVSNVANGVYGSYVNNFYAAPRPPLSLHGEEQPEMEVIEIEVLCTRFNL